MANMIRQLLFGGAGAATRFGDLGLLIVRVGVGGMLAAGHGYRKLLPNGLGEGFGPPQAFVQGLTDMGVPAPLVSAWLATLAEFLGGILLALGVFTRPVAVIVAFNMAVAAFVGHGDDPLFGPGRSKELALLYLLPALMLILTGAGRISLDGLLRNKRTA